MARKKTEYPGTIQQPESLAQSAWKVPDTNDPADKLQWLETPDREGRYAKPKTLVNSRCAWNDHGDRCEQAGSLSESTTGSGPWYCSRHYFELKGWGQVVKRQREPGEDMDEAA